MLYRRTGQVVRLLSADGEIQKMVVALTDGVEVQAVNYPVFAGECALGDAVLLNGTAQRLGLGSGGWDFVVANLTRSCSGSHDPRKSRGHLMKLRYTPLQLKVLAWDEEESPARPQDPMDYGDLAGRPVLVAGVHSLVEPTVRALSKLSPGSRIVYIMTDGACLPLFWSQVVRRLKAEGLIATTITTGHAFGGDYEALNKYSALACAAEVQADYIVVAMGPGIPGTGTKYGSTSLEVGEWLNAAASLGGRPVAVPRISTADPRPRHQGISHHFVTALKKIALVSAEVPLPYRNRDELRLVQDFVAWSSLNLGAQGVIHTVSFQDVTALARDLSACEPLFKSMGRCFEEDSLHFAAGYAAAQLVAAT
ncbi:MAG: DUF3866 family protein [Firmicutes bacterium]|nr:DUF3866 family protein [Bacillota bacterium]